LNHNDLRGKQLQFEEKAAAGSVSANTPANGASSRSARGIGESCRFHATHPGLDKSFVRNKSTAEEIVSRSRADTARKEMGETLHRDEVKRMLQDVMASTTLETYNSNKSSGWERPHPDRPLTPSHITRDFLRFENQVKNREAPKPKQESYQARQGIRFHSERARSATPDGGSFRGRNTMMGPGVSMFRREAPAPAAGGAAGRNSDARLRLDTPGGQDASLGRTRSLTPDYYRRYAENLAGTSLPGSNVALGAAGPQTPRTRRNAACDPRVSSLTSSADSRQHCRYHNAEDATNCSRRHNQDNVLLYSSRALATASVPTLASQPPTPISNTGTTGGSPAVTEWRSLRQRPQASKAKSMHSLTVAPQSARGAGQDTESSMRANTAAGRPTLFEEPPKGVGKFGLYSQNVAREAR